MAILPNLRYVGWGDDSLPRCPDPENWLDLRGRRSKAVGPRRMWPVLLSASVLVIVSREN